MEEEITRKQVETKTDQEDTDKITTDETRTEQEETKYLKVAPGGSCYWSERNRYQTEAGRYTAVEDTDETKIYNIDIDKTQSEVRFEQKETTQKQEDVRVELLTKEEENKQMKESLQSWQETLHSW